MNGNHDVGDESLAYVEEVTANTLSVLRQSYDDLHERTYKLATWLVAGGGAVGAYAITQFATGTSPLRWAPLAGLSLCWFGVAGPLIWRSMASESLSPGNGPKNLLNYYEARLAEPEATPENALRMTRRAELNLAQGRIREYADACVRRAEAMDLAYKAVTVASPAVIAVVALFVSFWTS